MVEASLVMEGPGAGNREAALRDGREHGTGARLAGPKGRGIQDGIADGNDANPAIRCGRCVQGFPPKSPPRFPRGPLS